MKKIMLLGGSAQQVIAVKTAQKMGYQTVLCDYLPDNPGRYVADRFYPVSTTDREAVLDVALHERINGILAYASDPAAPTAAYVAERMGLPSNPYQSVETLCNKDMFRKFLEGNGFNAPKSGGYVSIKEAILDIQKYSLPILVKPVDSSGSKGVAVVYRMEDLEEALNTAFSFSRNKRIIIEEFIEKGSQHLIGGDVFVSEGKIVLWGLMDCHRDERVNALVPVGKSYPVGISESELGNVKDTLQQIVDKLHICSGAMNVEVIVDKEGNAWPIDIGPRNGGNMIPELLEMIFQVDVVGLSIRAAMGEKISVHIGEGVPYYATHNVHSVRSGILQGVTFSNELKPYIARKCIYKHIGDKVEYFDDASKSLGVVFLRFPSKEKMQKILADINGHIEVVLKG